MSAIIGSRAHRQSRLELKTGDELETLSQEFNLMAANLKDAYESQERKVAERTEALSVANEKLEEVSKHKSDFLANVNHELRTPVSAIIGYSRLILRETEGQITCANSFHSLGWAVFTELPIQEVYAPLYASMLGRLLRLI